MFYYQFYVFANFMKSIGSNYLFVKPHVDAIFLLTAFELLNLATIWLLLPFESLLGNTNLDVAVAAICIFAINAFCMLHRKRYKKVIHRFEIEKKNIGAYRVIVIFYAIFTMLGFYFIHSRSI